MIHSDRLYLSFPEENPSETEHLLLSFPDSTDITEPQAASQSKFLFDTFNFEIPDSLEVREVKFCLDSRDVINKFLTYQEDFY